MNFKSILDKIFLKINEEPDIKKRSNEITLLESKLIENKVYRHQFELLTLMKEAKTKLKTENQLKNFIDKVRNKNYTFISENKLTPVVIWKENKALMEYYNINPKDIIPKVLDKSIDISSSKNLNQQAIRAYIGEVSKTDKTEAKRIIKESFQILLENKSQKDLNKQFKIIGFLASDLDNKNKTFVYESLRKLRSMQKNNYKECIQKLHKLRVLSEKLIREYSKDPKNPDSKESGSGKKVSLKDLKYIKNIQIEAPRNFVDPEKIVIAFVIPFYPIGAFFNEIRLSSIDIKNRLDRSERNFINSYVGKNSKLFNTKGVIWQVIMRVNGITAGNVVNGRVKLYLTAKPGLGNSFEDYYTAAYQMLKEFNTDLPELFPDELTPKAQQQALKQKDPNRKRAKRITNPKDPLDKAKRSKTRRSPKQSDGEEMFNTNDEFGGFF